MDKRDVELREQDRWLPIANVARLMKNTLPPTAKVSKDAKECMQECVSEFISFITSEASDRCLREKRKTINGEDILYSMYDLGFENYAEVLKIYLAKYREQQVLRQERGETRMTKKQLKLLAAQQAEAQALSGMDDTSESTDAMENFENGENSENGVEESNQREQVDSNLEEEEEEEVEDEEQHVEKEGDARGNEHNQVYESVESLEDVDAAVPEIESMNTIPLVEAPVPSTDTMES